MPDPRPQRAVGAARAAFKRRGDATALDDLYQQGCLKIRFPRPEPGDRPEAVLLNTSGGVAGGDTLDVAVDLAPGAVARASAQAAERFYRALPGLPPARVRTAISVGAGADMEWMPQETILFDGCALDRSLDIDVAPDARFLGIEMLVFGRAAMGERVEAGHLRDRIAISRGGERLWLDPIRLSGPIAATLDRPAVAGGSRALGTVAMVAPDAEARLDAARAALESTESGVSAWNGMLVARILAPTGADLRRAALRVLAVVRDGRPPPRVWMC